MGKKNDRRSRSKSHEKSSNWRPKEDSPKEPQDEHDTSSDDEQGEEGFMGTLSMKEKAELEEKKIKAAGREWAKANREKEQRDQWVQNQKWNDIRSKRAVVTATAREERVMKENYAVYTGEKGEENYIEGEEAGWYYCRLCSKKSATYYCHNSSDASGLASAPPMMLRHISLQNCIVRTTSHYHKSKRIVAIL
mmetsp:Transcript_3868/g.3170  ORF Transcript_3868/g.3170 Transcript_3868/m.3170 type:complete len:193 (+) Transcript_3868:54-632(+)